MGFNWCFSFACCLAPMALHRQAAYCICESSFLINHGGYLFVLDDSLTS